MQLSMVLYEWWSSPLYVEDQEKFIEEVVQGRDYGSPLLQGFKTSLWQMTEKLILELIYCHVDTTHIFLCNYA